MAQTEDGKKRVYVHEHTKGDGTKVPTHYRSTPDHCKPCPPAPKPSKGGKDR